MKEQSAMLDIFLPVYQWFWLHIMKIGNTTCTLKSPTHSMTGSVMWLRITM